MSTKKNLVYSMMYQILILIIPLITTPYVARVLGPDAIGEQAYTNSIVNYFVLFSMLGINNYGNRNIAMSRDNQEMLNRTFTSIYIVQVIMSLCMLTIYFLIIIVLKSKHNLLFIIQSIYIIAAGLDINWFFFGMEKFKLTVIRNTIIKMVSMICVFLFVKDIDDIYIYTFILAIGTLISNLILWKFINKYVKFTRISKYEVKQHIKPILILFIPVIAVSMYKIMDKIMLGSLSGATQVGLYENSEKIIYIPLTIISAVGTVMMPKMANLEITGNINQGKKYIKISMEFVMIVSFAALFGLVGVSDILIPIFLGNQFIDSINIVKILSLTILFISWANIIRTQFLIPKGKDKIYIKSTIIGAIVNFILNLVLIKRYGAIGAAVGTILAEASVAIYQTIKVKGELDIKEYINKCVFYIIPGIIMYVGVKYVEKINFSPILTLILQVIIGGCIYVSISLLYMYITKNEIIYILKNKNYKYENT